MISPSVVGAVSAFDQHGDRNALGAFAAVACRIVGMVLLGRAAGAENVEDVGDILGGAWLR